MPGYVLSYAKAILVWKVMILESMGTTCVSEIQPTSLSCAKHLTFSLPRL